MQEMIKVRNLTKRYQGEEPVLALQDVTLNIEQGTFYCIKGASGAGKSTLLNLLGLLDTPTSGEIYIGRKSTAELSEEAKAHIRMKYLGFVFQEFYLNETLRAYENVMIPMFINPKIPETELEARAKRLLKLVGLEHRINHYPKALSGGEKQRVAVARALANNPQCILADEPTGSLDQENGFHILELLKKLSLAGKSVVVVSHSPETADYADRIFTVDGGKVTEERSNETEI